ncbi:hypothetical protein RM530_01405 [Algiphilus sp. W345]|uniref:Uncharacterized protein n=1 Tax=Banduia mediterranea TaxID=3075609 RepID=A0ABU2WDR5_9GAMM|nr:hypothetical protein [Algiphilus sp. W345]MDT0496024.1 hypothetical protein [Algiphilus sp. W345]
MNTALREGLTQFHRRFQQELVPLVEANLGPHLTPTTDFGVGPVLTQARKGPPRL